jgi:hypothetical protein
MICQGTIQPKCQGLDRELCIAIWHFMEQRFRRQNVLHVHSHVTNDRLVFFLSDGCVEIKNIRCGLSLIVS